MPLPHLALSRVAQDDLHPWFDIVRDRNDVPRGFSRDVLDEAHESARSPRLPALELLDLPFVTLDPPGSADLDQAFALQRRGSGYLVHYAIADLAAFVDPDGLVAAEAWSRVVTLYCPDTRVPLHPPVLSERAASLLPDAVRPAVVWSIELDTHGSTTRARVRRALIRSRDRLDYPTVQQQLDAGRAHPMIKVLTEVGELLAAAQTERGGANLPLPEQAVVRDDNGYHLAYRQALPVERCNAQLSLLTGRAAAALMLQAGVGIVRSMPEAAPRDVRRLRGVAEALGVTWPSDQSYGHMLAQLDDTGSPAVVAFLNEAASLFRGAGYAAFDQGAPADSAHAAIADHYTHCTAPIRRLVDRFASEVCLAIAAEQPVPEWALQALPDLPGQMRDGQGRAGSVERAALDVVEWAKMRPLAGRRLPAVVTDVVDETHGEVALLEPAVIAACRGRLELGETVEVEVVTTDEPPVRLVRAG